MDEFTQSGLLNMIKKNKQFIKDNYDNRGYNDFIAEDFANVDRETVINNILGKILVLMNRGHYDQLTDKILIKSKVADWEPIELYTMKFNKNNLIKFEYDNINKIILISL